MKLHTLPLLPMLIVGLSACLQAFAISPDRASELIVEINKASRFDCINLTEEERAFLLDYLKKEHRKSGNDYEEFAELEFLQLGDQPTILRLVDRLHQQSKSWASQELTRLQRSGQASVVEAISDLLFRQEAFQYFGTDYLEIPTSFAVASAMLKIVSDSPQFAPEVTHWANGVKALDNHDKENREIMRKWYRQNEGFFKAHNYRAVQPPLEKPLNSSSVEPPPTNESPSNHVSAPVSSPGNTQTQESSGNIYAWIAAFLLAVCGGLAWLLKRKRI